MLQGDAGLLETITDMGTMKATANWRRWLPQSMGMLEARGRAWRGAGSVPAQARARRAGHGDCATDPARVDAVIERFGGNRRNNFRRRGRALPAAIEAPSALWESH